MIKSEFEKSDVNLCNLKYLTDIMGGKKNLIKGIMDAFLLQMPEELVKINAAVENVDYPVIKNLAHTMKSSVSIMDIAIIIPVLQELETLASGNKSIERIRVLNTELNTICNQAIIEIEKQKHNYE